MKNFSAMPCQDIVPENKYKNENKYKKFNDFVYFTFPFIYCLKKLLHFLHFNLMINLLVHNMSYYYFFWKFSKMTNS